VLDIDAPEHARRSAYTALYHTMLGPTLFMDADGQYRGSDNAVHKADGFTHYSTFSLWDTYRALHPLLTLVQPEKRNSDFVNSMLAHHEHSPYGMLPVWSFHGLEDWCMIGYHAVPVIADAYVKGIRGFDADKALKAMVETANYGPMTVSRSTASWATCRSTRKAKRPARRWNTPSTTGPSHAWRRRWARPISRPPSTSAPATGATFDKDTGFMRARKRDGSFRTPFDPSASGYGTDYTEGNAWQYSWYVPQDVAGLAAAHGGSDKPLARLDEVFNAKVDPSIFEHMEDITGLIGWYAHGNEPSHHVAYLYSYAGQPWRTQARLKQIMDTQYADRPDGLAGNDDVGQMSAWYVFTALGFYPVAPGSGEYILGRPFLPKTAMRLPNGKTFTIVAEGWMTGTPMWAA
jgi:putative alpha-1,2-mannosidase